MGGVRTKIAKCILNIGRSLESSFEVCGQNCKFRSVNLWVRVKRGNGKAEKRVKGGKAEKRVKDGKGEKRVKGGKAEKRVKGGKKSKRRKKE